MCILTYNGGQNVQTFQKIDPLVMTSVHMNAKMDISKNQWRSTEGMNP